MFNPQFDNFMEVAQQLGFEVDFINYDAVVQREKDEVQRKRYGKNPKLLALMPPPARSTTAIADEAPWPLPSITGSYTVEFDEEVKTYKVRDNSSGDCRWYPKRGVKPVIDKTPTGITILTDADGENLIASELFGPVDLAGTIDWLLCNNNTFQNV